MARSVQHPQFMARYLTLATTENGRLLPQGLAGAAHTGWEGGRGLEITCRWGSLEPLCKHGWNGNKVVLFFFIILFFSFFFLQRPVWSPSTTLQAELHTPFQKGTTVQEIGPTSPIQCWLCVRRRPSASVVFLHCGHKEWEKKKEKKRVVIVGEGKIAGIIALNWNDNIYL